MRARLRALGFISVQQAVERTQFLFNLVALDSGLCQERFECRTLLGRNSLHQALCTPDLIFLVMELLPQAI
jgi:hypothetical protein